MITVNSLITTAGSVLVGYWLVIKSKKLSSGRRQRMTEIALTVKEIFPHYRLLEFFSRGTMEVAAHQIFRWLGGKTYEEWFEYFEANDFQPKNFRETPVFGKVMTIFYQGMVLEAEDAAQSWLDLSKDEREKYKSLALAIAQRERVNWNFLLVLQCAFYSLLIFHNIFKDSILMQSLCDKYVAIIFEVVASEEKTSDITYQGDEPKLAPSMLLILDKIQDRQEEKNIEDTIALIDSWETKYTTDEMQETLETFKKGIDEDREGGRKLFS